MLEPRPSGTHLMPFTHQQIFTQFWRQINPLYKVWDQEELSMRRNGASSSLSFLLQCHRKPLTLLFWWFCYKVWGLTFSINRMGHTSAAKDISREADIARLKYFRNTVYAHAEQASVDDTTFNTYWHDIRDTLVRLGGVRYVWVIDQARGQDGWILTKFFFGVFWTKSRSINSQKKNEANI